MTSLDPSTYIGLPTYDSFIALVTYLEPKAIELRLWNGSKTRGEDEKVESGVRYFTSLTIADQLFSVLIRLRCGLDTMRMFNLCFVPNQ